MYANAQSHSVRGAVPAIKLHQPDGTIPPELQALPGWSPSNGSPYFYLESHGKVAPATWSSSAEDHGRYALGNVFSTPAKASLRADRQALNRITDFLLEECGAGMALGQFVIRRNHRGAWTVVNTGFLAPAEARFEDAEEANHALRRLQALGMVPTPQ